MGGKAFLSCDLDSVQPPSTGHLTKEIILEPSDSSANISETIQECRTITTQNSVCCLLTRRGCFPGKRTPQAAAVMATGHSPGI